MNIFENMTLTMIKPDAVRKGFAGHIIARITDAEFAISAMKLTSLSHREARMFYAEHEGKHFFDSLVNFMASGPIYAAILLKENAVEEYRRFIGSTNPADAKEGTIRKIYGESKSFNAVHGSDSITSANREADFFFSRRERYYFLNDNLHQSSNL